MIEKFSFIFILGIFTFTQLLGLYIGNQYIQSIKIGEAVPIFENPEKIENSFFIIFYILIGTSILILAVKFFKFFIRIIEALAVFFSSSIAFEFLFPFGYSIISAGFVLGFILTAWKMLRPSILSQNLALIFSVAGAGALIGASLGIFPVLIFIILLSIYDIIAVFFTKHMIYIAKEITKSPTAFTLAVPHKFEKPVKFRTDKGVAKKKVHVFQLGGGDIAIPLIFSVSILRSFSILNSFFAILGAVFALGVLFYFILRRPGLALPALPWISSGMLAIFLISIFIFG